MNGSERAHRMPDSEQERGTTIRNKKMTKPKSISVGGEDL